MSMVIKPKNWKEFQHYKDRNPPWIKLHKSLLDNYEFHSLQLASKALAPCYWLLASEHPEGFITVDARKLAWRFRTDEKTITETVKELIANGFFELVQGDSALLASCYQDAMPETETETETNTLSSGDDGGRKSERIPYDSVFETYEDVLCVHPYNRPRVKVRDDKRKSAIKKIWAKSDKTKTIDWWREYFQAATVNDHWMKGDKHKGGSWDGANFDFLLRDDVFKRIVEGAV